MATPSAQQQHQDYFRSVSSESTTYMMVPAGAPSGTRRREAPSKMWVAMVVIVVVVLQIASTTGLFLYLNMSISQVRAGFHSPCVPLFFYGGILEPYESKILQKFRSCALNWQETHHVHTLQGY